MEDIIIEKIREKYDEYSRQKPTKNNRCKYARENETLGESIARHQGFLI